MNASAISEPMTWEEICARYRDEHVWLVDLARDRPGLVFRTARVIAHSRDRREAFALASAWFDRYPLVARRYTGRSSVPLVRPTFEPDDADGIPHR